MVHETTSESAITDAQHFLDKFQERMALKPVSIGDFYRALQAGRLRQEEARGDEWMVTDYRALDGSLVAYRLSVDGHSPQFYLKTH